MPDDLECYVVSSYDASKKQAKTERITGSIYSDLGMIVKGTVGATYILDTNLEVANSPTDLLKGPAGGAPFTANSTSSTDVYVFNTSTRKFDRLNGTMSIYSGEAYMPLSVNTSHSVSNITVDLFGSSFLKGDVNRDGKVNVSDVSALINMIMGITAVDQEVADVNGDGRVNVSDVSALINIILGVS